jgi:hypothetical protein
VIDTVGWITRKHLGIALLVVLTAGCGAPVSPSLPSSSGPPSSGPRKIADPYTVSIDPAAFSTTIDNPYMPLIPGTRTIYHGAGPRGRWVTTTEVTRDTKTVMGVDTVVVHDTVSVDGKVTEDTYDWYAQDRDKNVWYFGEDTKKIEDGTVDTTGSFEGGLHGALPGIAMLARPQVGDQYRQEYARGLAEDAGEVLNLSGSETTPLTGPAQDLLITKDVDLLNPAVVENKYYARGRGLVLTVTVTGAPEREEAISFQKI